MANTNQNATVDQNAQAQAQQQQQAQQPTQAQPEQQTQIQQSDEETINTENSLAEMMKQVAELKAETRRLKKANDSLASENGGLRKQVNAKLTEEELKAQQKSEREEETAKRIAELEARVALNEAVKRYMSMGMLEEQANRVAQAELDGDQDTVFTNLKAFMEQEKKKAAELERQEMMKNMPAPASGNGDGQIDYAKISQDALANGDISGFIHSQLMGAQQTAN